MPNSKNIKVRAMTEADLDEVLAIETASFVRPWSRDDFQSELQAVHSFPFVATEDEIIVGYVCLMSLFEEAQILDIAVDLKLRGSGIAGILLDHAISVARGKCAEVIALEVRDTNIAALSLYEKYGFIRTGLRRKYYEGKDDAVLMEKRLG